MESRPPRKSLANQSASYTGLRMIDVQVGPYYVLNTRTCPPPWSRSVFMTNYGDVNSLRDRLVLDNAARGIVSGIMTI